MNVSGIDALKEIAAFNPKARELDPYGIFKNNIDALGGNYAVSNDKNYYIEGNISINRKSYTFDEMWMKPLKNVMNIYDEKNKNIFSSGDDGIMMWNRVGDDVNVLSDDINRRKLNLLRENYGFMDPNSDVFSIDSTKKRFLNGEQVYEIEVSNKLNDEIDTYFYSAKDFMLKKHINEIDNVKVETNFSDYKQIAGMMKAHRIEEKNMSTNRTEIREIKTYKRNIMMDREDFEIPEPEEESSLMQAI